MKTVKISAKSNQYRSLAGKKLTVLKEYNHHVILDANKYIGVNISIMKYNLTKSKNNSRSKWTLLDRIKFAIQSWLS